MNVYTELNRNPLNSCRDISTKDKNVNLTVVLQDNFQPRRKEDAWKHNKQHHMNVCTKKLHTLIFKSGRWSNWPTDRQTLPSLEPCRRHSWKNKYFFLCLWARLSTKRVFLFFFKSFDLQRHSQQKGLKSLEFYYQFKMFPLEIPLLHSFFYLINIPITYHPSIRFWARQFICTVLILFYPTVP